MSTSAPDPSGPQWTSGWEYQAGAALQRMRQQGEGGPPAPRPPDPAAQRRKQRRRRIRAVVFAIAAIAFAIGAVADAVTGGFSPVAPLVLAVGLGLLAGWQARLARRTPVTEETGEASGLIETPAKTG
jgi:hypothetical protein